MTQNVTNKFIVQIRKRQARQDTLVNQPLTVWRKAWLGDNQGNIFTYNGLTLPDGYVVVRDFDGNLSVAYNQRVPTDRAGIPINVGYDPLQPTLFQVLGQFDAYINQPGISVPPHHKTHEWPSQDTVYVNSFQFLPALVTGNNGLVITIFPSFFLKSDGTWGYLGYQTFDMTSYVPSTSAQAFLVTVKDDETISIVSGTTEVTPELITTADFPTVPGATYHAICAVRLYSGQAAITQTATYTDIFDLRTMGGAGIGGISGPAGGDLAGFYPDPTVFQAHLTDQLAPTPPASGTIILQSFNQQGFSVPHIYDTTGAALELTRDNLFVVRNVSGSLMTKGQVVTISGSTGAVPQVTLAKANSRTTLGEVVVLFEDIANNAYGRAAFLGYINNIDMSAFSTGDLLYVSATTAGALTNVAPSSPNYIQLVGCVINNGVSGILQIYSRGVQGINDAPADGYLYVRYNGAWLRLPNSFKIDASTGTGTTYGALSGAINGSNTTFIASAGSYISGTLHVYLNGQLQTQGTSSDWKETTPGSGTFDFITAPVSGDIILVAYQSVAAGTVGSGNVTGPASAVDGHIAVFDGTTGTKIKDGGAVLWSLDTPPGTPSSQNDEFTTTLNAAWAIVAGISGTVTLTGQAGVYDLASILGRLLVQIDGATHNWSMYQSYTLADGESVILALAPSVSETASVVDNAVNVWLSVNNSAAAGSYGFVAGADGIFWNTNTGNFGIGYSSNGSYVRDAYDPAPLGKKMYFRISRAGLVYTAFYSLDGETWIPLGKRTWSAPADHIWLAIDSAVAGTGLPTPSPITAFDWFRIGNNNVRPW